MQRLCPRLFSRPVLRPLACVVAAENLPIDEVDKYSSTPGAVDLHGARYPPYNTKSWRDANHMTVTNAGGWSVNNNMNQVRVWRACCACCQALRLMDSLFGHRDKIPSSRLGSTTRERPTKFTSLKRGWVTTQRQRAKTLRVPTVTGGQGVSRKGRIGVSSRRSWAEGRECVLVGCAFFTRERGWTGGELH